MTFMNSHSNYENRYKYDFIFPIVLIAAGMLFLGVNTGFLPIEFKSLFTSWPIWAILSGLYFLLKNLFPKNTLYRSFFGATVLLTLGTFFIVPQIAGIHPEWNIPENFTQLYWPVLLIVAGIYFALVRMFKPHCFPKRFQKFCCTGNMSNKWESEEGFLRINSTFESKKNIVLDPIFKGGNVECSFGEIVLDLRKTNLPEGKTRLNVKVSFGSIVIIVPDAWNVKLQGESIFGAFTDNRNTQTHHPEDNRELIVDGKCSFGECKLQD